MKSGVLAILCSLFLVAGTAAAAQRETVFKDDRTLGDPKAPVVVVEYLAPVCPHCARFAATVFPEIKRSYIDTGKVFYVIRIFPLTAVDGAVAGMAKCMPPDRYYEFLDLAFKNQPLWDPDGYQIADQKAALVQLGGMAGLKPDEASVCMKDAAEFARVNRIAQDAVERLHIEAVPSLIVDGKVLLGSVEASWPALQSKIDGLLAQAALPSKPAGIEVAPLPNNVGVAAKLSPKHGHPKLHKKKHKKPVHHKKAPHKKAKPAHKSAKAKAGKKH